MSVITISRDFGSEGDYIAEKVAQILGYHFVDKEFFSKVLSQYGLIEFDEEYDVLPGFWEKLDPHQHERRGEVVDMLNRTLRAVAQHGNVVILGRSGFEVLGRICRYGQCAPSGAHPAADQTRDDGNEDPVRASRRSCERE